MKTLAMNDGVGRKLDPEFNVLSAAEPFVRKLIRQRIRPEYWEPALRRTLIDLARMGVELPGDLRRLARHLGRSEFTVVTRIDGYEAPLRRLEAMVNRLVMAVIVSALILGTAMAVVFTEPGKHSWWFSGLMTVGFVAMALLGLWLVIGIWRSGRR